ncbi:hypothetical protein Taro_032481 [Colocasia esculenta]|uniref:U-box domain-containing protein n=1 Tax=Colocasia esculenta TaxID=4460 RepID=A0A843W414_COLES|nr:hypothetical protein [Colocasia esculenta]
MAPLSATQGQGVEVPPYFLCPISLQIMRDPVILATGITYDRDSIEKWVYSGAGEKGAAAATCPVSKQPLPHDAEMTPNHTLRRLIQAWCVANASHGVERFPTPRQPVNKAQIAQLLEDARAVPGARLASLRKLRHIVGESERNRRSAEAAGAPEFLISVVWDGPEACAGDEAFSSGGGGSACEEALCVLHALKVSPEAFSELVGRHANLFEPLTAVLRRSNCQSRAYAIFLLRSVVEAVAPARLLSLEEELFQELVRVIRDQVSDKATKAALRILARLCLWGRNRTKATKAGGVPVLVELLLDDPEQRVCEMALVILDQLCGCAEGRAELVGHAAGLAVVSKKVLRVSPLATERAVRVLYAVARSSAAPALLQEMLQVGVVSKLCLLLQTDCGGKAKEKAQEVLRLHSRAWKNSPCIPPKLLASFPRH